MLTRERKEEIVSGLKENIEKANAIILTNLIGVTSNDSVAIRKSIRDAGGSVVVTRNTLFRKGGEGTAVEGMLSNLKGPHAVAFSFDDAAAVAKSLKNASKENETVEFKGGFLDGKELSVAELVALAELPSRDEMLGTLLATFNAPISALARVLNSIREKKEEGGGEVVEVVAEEAPAVNEDAPVAEEKSEAAAEEKTEE